MFATHVLCKLVFFFAKRDITFIEAKIDIQVLCKKQKNKKQKKNLNAKKKKFSKSIKHVIIPRLPQHLFLDRNIFSFSPGEE